MAICKRPASSVFRGQAQPNSSKKRIVARRTVPSTIKKPVFVSAEDYEETTYLGEGTYGVVYKGRHRATGQTVAIKFLGSPPERAGEPADSRELLREARFLESCSGNPHVVGFHCVVRDPATGELGLVMEFVGRSLKDFLAEKPGKPLPEATVRAFMRQLLTGAKGMHERGILHRDIKPGNVLVGEGQGGEVLKICDFGLAISASQQPPLKQAGTKLYRAPEMLMGKAEYDALADAWSLGCVMAELVSGDILLWGVDTALIDMPQCPEEFAYLWTIFGVLGTPDDATWPGFNSLPLAANMPPLKLGHRSQLRKLIPEATLSEQGFEVLNGLLACNPDKRLTAADALKLPWFADASNSPPLPAAAAADDGEKRRS